MPFPDRYNPGYESYFLNRTTNTLNYLSKITEAVTQQGDAYLHGDAVFKNATARGVNIKILTNSILSNDNYEAFAGYQKCRENILKTGVRLFEFKPDAADRFKLLTGALQQKMNYVPIFRLHAKTMVIDDSITVIGTFNLDPRSANLNTECFAIIHSAQITKGVLVGMELESKPENSWETTLTFNPDSKATLKTRANLFIKKLVPKSIL